MQRSAFRRALPFLPLLCIWLAGAHALPTAADAETPSDASPMHGRRLEQVPTTLPACKAQLTTSMTQLATCKTQLNATTVARKACTTKLTACTQSYTAKQLSACQRRGAAYNGQAAAAITKLQRCNAVKDALAKENSKLKAAVTPVKRTVVTPVKRSVAVAAVAAEADPLTACQQQVAVLQAQVDALNASLAGAQAALNATQTELDSMNVALVQRDADVAALQEQLATASEQLQQFGEQEAELAALRWQLSQLQQLFNVTDGMLNQTRDDLDRVNAEVDGLREANASCHVQLSNQGAKVEDAQAEVEACQLATAACAQERASLQEAFAECSANQFPPEEYVTCANKLISCQIANETNANAAGECQSQLSDAERSYQECMSRNRRLLKLPGGRPALSRSTT